MISHQCTQLDVRSALASLIESHLRQMPREDLVCLSEACDVYLPSRPADFQQSRRLQAAILLGFIAWVQVDVLSETSRTHTTQALISIMREPACGTEAKAAAADVLAKSYKELQKYYRLKEIFMSMLTGCTMLRPSENQDATVSVCAIFSFFSESLTHCGPFRLWGCCQRQTLPFFWNAFCSL